MNTMEKPYDRYERFQAEKPPQLYMARIEKGSGTLILTQDVEQKIGLQGEIVIVSSGFGEQGPVIDALQRAAFWTDPVNELEGVLSMGGSAEKFMAEPATEGELAQLEMFFYYPLLSRLEPAFVESDAVYPQLETFRGRMLWHLGERIDEKSFIMKIEVILDEPVEAPLGAIKQFTLDPIFLTFVLLEEAGEAKPPSHRSLVTCTSSTLNTSGSYPYYELKLKFVNLSPTRTIAQLEGTAAQPGIVQQLIDRACEVWWAKGGIKITPYNSAIQPATPWPGGAVSAGQESSLGTIQPSQDAVEVYLVDRLTAWSGGGVTYGCGTDGAFVIIDIGKAEHNKYVLAHEIGHVLGVSHPDGTGANPILKGSTCSVMVVDKPNSSRNTSNNFNLIAGPIGSVLRTMGTGGRKTEDNYEHYIRDFPYDAAIQPSTPQPPALHWWTHSDVWNFSKAPSEFNTVGNPAFYNGEVKLMFDPDDNFPNAEEPSYVGPNYMYIRLHARDFAQPVKVHLFLAVPGSASETLTRLPVVGPGAANPLIFNPVDFRSSGEPVVKYVQWAIPTDSMKWPAGFPAACCVFAVIQSSIEPTPDIDTLITNFASRHFYDLFSRLTTDNDVAQRNLHIQGTANASNSSGSNRSFSSMLSWVQMDNPFEHPAPGCLEIDATQAIGLESLSLEVGEEIVAQIKPGERTTITISDALQPGEHKILRFRATLPPSVSEGMSFPIHLRFVVNDVLVGGYSHVLRVVPLSEAVLQVMDLLFGALRAVAVGCGLDLAQPVADVVKTIVLKERSRRATGCFGLLWRIVRPGNKWNTEAMALAESIGPLVQSLNNRNEPECQMVRKHLMSLVNVLRTSKDTPAPVLIEQIRDLADRIQEPAGRLARLQLKS